MANDELLPTVDEIHEIHDLIVSLYDLEHDGVIAHFPDRRLESILQEVSQSEDDYGRAALLLRRLSTAHVFADGNKRTAWVTAETYLRREGVTVEPPQKEASKLMKHLRRFTVGEIATWLETGCIDRDRFRDD